MHTLRALCCARKGEEGCGDDGRRRCRMFVENLRENAGENNYLRTKKKSHKRDFSLQTDMRHTHVIGVRLISARKTVVVVLRFFPAVFPGRFSATSLIVAIACFQLDRESRERVKKSRRKNGRKRLSDSSSLSRRGDRDRRAETGGKRGPSSRRKSSVRSFVPHPSHILDVEKKKNLRYITCKCILNVTVNCPVLRNPSPHAICREKKITSERDRKEDVDAICLWVCACV